MGTDFSTILVWCYESETYDFSGIELLGLLLLNWRTQRKRAVSISTHESGLSSSPCALYTRAELPPYQIGVQQREWDIFAAPRIRVSWLVIEIRRKNSAFSSNVPFESFHLKGLAGLRERFSSTRGRCLGLLGRFAYLCRFRRRHRSRASWRSGSDPPKFPTRPATYLFDCAF